MHTAVQITLIIVGAWVVVALIAGIVLWRFYKSSVRQVDAQWDGLEARWKKQKAERDKRAAERRAERFKRW